MSRTVRRVGKSYNPRQMDWCIEVDYPWVWRAATPRREYLQGKEFNKGWWIVHRDGFLNFAWHRWTWGEVRSKNKTDLNHWLHNDEHECFFWEDINKADWTD